MQTSRWAVLAIFGALAGTGALAAGGCGNQASDTSGGQGDGGGAGDSTTGGDGGLGNSSGASSGAASSGAASSGGGASSGAASSGGGASSGAASSGSGAGGDGACEPVTACPSGVTCGRYTDPCSGQVFICGSGCQSGAVCMATPGDPTAQSCVLTGGTQGICTGECGEIGYDACGVAINCGGCAAGLSCIGNHCVTPTPPTEAGAVSDACVPLTCTPNAQTELCGTIDTGCGGTIHCSCTTGVCLGGVCAPEPPECELGDGGAKCGTVENACGSGTLACAGTCTGTTQCMNNVCTACTPPSCGTKVCGTVSNGCGPSVSCGTCGGTSEVCYSGACCTPSTCAEALEAGAPDGGAIGCQSINLGCGTSSVCAPCPGGEVCNANACCRPQTCAEAIDAGIVTSCTPVNLGCGVTQTCAPCPTGESCNANACTTNPPCVSKTCADFDGGCGHSDGCGNTLNCCGDDLSCQGGTLCCGAGMVDYNGSCCLPQCNEGQPSGYQVSCGQTLYCNGGH